MSDDIDIVKRLRSIWMPVQNGEIHARYCHQAADEIERLRAERDALVEQRDRWIAGTQLHAASANENPPEIRSHRDSADA